jgi:uncharacterized protein (DUF433 family)
MTNAQLKIIIYAVKSRIKRGEDITEIIASYPKLSEEEITKVKEAVGITE